MPGFAYVSLLEGGVAAGIVILGGYLLSRSVVEHLRRAGAPPHAVRGAKVAISAVAFALAAAIILLSLGSINTVSGLTFSAIVGLAGTLALQTTLQNMIAGFVLLRNRMLRLGDIIVISGITGMVVQVGLLTVWLRLEDGSVAFVSNSTLLSGPLLNRSAGNRLQGEY
jgi:small conductance mechanosensitive channel